MYAARLEDFCHAKIVSNWHEAEGDDEDYDDDFLGEIAMGDLLAIDQCDTFLLFTEDPGEEVPGASRGGRFVEMGYAIAKGKRVCVIGPLENIFCRLQGVEQFDTIEEFLKKYGGAK